MELESFLLVTALAQVGLLAMGYARWSEGVESFIGSVMMIAAVILMIIVIITSV